MPFLNDLFGILAGVQSNGGLMLVLCWILFEVKYLKKAFFEHEDRYVHTERRAARPHAYEYDN